MVIMGRGPRGVQLTISRFSGLVTSSFHFIPKIPPLIKGCPKCMRSSLDLSTVARGILSLFEYSGWRKAVFFEMAEDDQVGSLNGSCSTAYSCF